MKDLVKKYGGGYLLVWTFFLAIILAAILYQHHDETIDEAVLEARNYYHLNLHYRAWNAQLGGVYAPVGKVAPNPYLDVPNRDVIMPDGTPYTLVNPAYMTRLVFERVNRQNDFPIISKLTSLKPVNPTNKADAWEATALAGFERGEKEIFTVASINGQPYLRFMGRFVTTPECLKCHEKQGYKVGDIRGGLSISIPLAASFLNEYRTDRNMIAGFVLLWLFGCAGISGASRKRFLQEQALRQSQVRLLENVASLGTAKGELQALNEKLLIVTDGIPAMIVHVDADQRFLYANRAYTEWVGIAEGELIGKTVREAIGEDAYVKVMPYIEQVLRGVAGQMERTLLINGVECTQMVNFVPQFDSEGRVPAYFGFITDVSEMKKTEKNLKESEWLLRESQKVARLGSFTYSFRDGTWTGSDILDQIFGIDAGFCRNLDGWLKIVHQDDREAMRKYLDLVIDQEVTFNREYRIINQTTGETRWVSGLGRLQLDQDGAVVAMIGTIQDITTHRDLEEQLRHSQKMEAVGQLAGGVAHDFNNILTVILGYCTLLRMRSLNDRQTLSDVEQIISAAERGAHLTQGLLTFSRRDTMSPVVQDLNDIVKHVQGFIVRIIGEDIRFEVACCKNPLHVTVDGSQVEQMLFNLATNARDAMPRGGGFRLATEAVELNEAFVQAHGYGLPGTYARIIVSDTGCGMDEETCKRIFDPFYTTKDVGKGTGLGLAIVYGTVRQHEGYITVHSDPGKGTTFSIYFPLTQSTAVVKGTESLADLHRKGSETILVVEDDPSVREIVETVLRQFHYDVILAVDGRDGVEKFRQHRQTIKLVLMDIIMPVMNGREASDEIRRMQPDVKVLFISGYTAEIIRNRGEVGEGADILAKPVQPVELLRKVREMLDSVPK